MARKIKSVKPPPKAQEKLRVLLGQAQKVEALLQSYAEGVSDTLELVGVWKLDVSTMTFVYVPKKGQRARD